MKSSLILGLIASVSASVIPRWDGSTYNFTLSVDNPQSPLHGFQLSHDSWGLMLNLTGNHTATKPTYFQKRGADSPILFAAESGIEESSDIIPDWVVGVLNDTSPDSGVVRLHLQRGLQDVKEPHYFEDFLVTGNSFVDPYPHIGFRTKDRIGKGGWYACPGPVFGSYAGAWQLYGGTAGFSNAPHNLTCVELGNLKVNLV